MCNIFKEHSSRYNLRQSDFSTPRYNSVTSYFCFINWVVDNVDWPPWRDSEVDVSSVNLSSRQIEESWVVCGLYTERWSYATGLTSLDAFFVVFLYVRETTRRPMPRTTSLRKERPQKTSKLVATHFSLPNYSKGVSLHQGSTESRKTLGTNIYFSNRHSHGINERFSVN